MPTRVRASLQERKRLERALAESEKRFRTAFVASPVGIEIFDADGRLTDANPACLALFGVEDINELRGFRLFDAPNLSEELVARIRTGVPACVELDFDFERVRSRGLYRTSERGVKPLRFFITPLGGAGEEPGGYLLHVLDDTERKEAKRAKKRKEARLSALLRLADLRGKTLQETLDIGLDEAVKLTESVLGYLYFYDEETRRFTLWSWSESVMPACAIVEKQTVYELEKTGLWGEAVRQRRAIITNDYAAPNPLKKGYPEGHVALTRHLNMPVLRGGRIVAVVGVGNKATDYDEEDVRQLELYMGGVWGIFERKQAVEELRRLYEQTERDAEGKARLLDEVNHRVKNNLLSVLGLLLAERRLAPPEAAPLLGTVLDRLSGRIRGLLSAHTLLSDTQWAPLPVNALTAEVVGGATAGAAVGTARIDLDTSASTAVVSPRQAANLALVLNELATNTLKHGAGSSGPSRVAVRSGIDGDRVAIEYRDDGPGYPAEVVEGQRPGAGLKLIEELVCGSLRGQVSFASDAGAVTTLWIKAEEPRRT